MDKMVHTALNSLKMILQNQQITSQNISNASVVGYRRDSNSEFGTAYLNSEEGLNTRVFATREIGAFSTQQGDLESTENPLDVAIKGEGYFIIQPKEGEVALSRRGDFKVDVEGQLVNGEGSLVLGEDLQPIVLPAFNAIQISSDGLINIKPIDAPIDAPFQLAATLGTTTAEELELEKDINGFIKPKATTNENGEIEVAEITANQQVQMVNNYLEKSNVNPVEELILTKYLRNSFLATKVAFFNEVYNLCEKAGIDYNQVKALVGMDERITHSHMNVPGPDGDRGFGGACFPKDSLALAKYGKSINAPIDILEAVIKKNNKIRSKYDKLESREIEQNVSFDDKI